MPSQRLHAEARFYLKQLDPDFELYVSPLNLDPLSPAMPVSHPAQLRRRTGARDRPLLHPGHARGHQGPQDRRADRTPNFSPRRGSPATRTCGSTATCWTDFDDGFLFYYFGNVDQVSHMMWRPMDPGHPAYNAATDAPFRHVVEDLYVGLDRIVGETLKRLGPNDLLVVMSDHGFASWRRAFNLNSLAAGQRIPRRARGRSRRRAPGSSRNVDWSRTPRLRARAERAVHQRQRPRADGVVDPRDREALVAEIAAKLVATIDPRTGAPAITRVFRREEVYKLAGFEDIAPDMIVGYAKGTRSSDESALGGLAAEVFEDNTTPWTGDHCMDPDAVPGMLLTSRPLGAAAPTLQALAAAILAEFGILDFRVHEEN